MNFFETVLGLIVSTLAILGGTAIAITWMGIRYSERKRGLTKGASRAELDEIKRDLAAIRRELEQVRESQADVALTLHDLPSRMIPSNAPKDR